MKTDPRIPIVIGVTGHRMLDAHAISRLDQQVRDALLQLQSSYPHSPIRMLNSLAEGADALCARIASELSIPLDVPLPLPLLDYRQDFSGENLALFDAQIASADRVFVAPQIEKAPDVPSRENAYRQAGLYIVRHCHILFSVWDGSDPISGACGTAEITDAFLNGSYLPAFAPALRPMPEGLAIQFFALRAGENNQETGDMPRAPQPLCDPKEMVAALQRTDAYNKEAMNATFTAVRLFQQTDPLDVRLENLQAVYAAADGLSCGYDAKNRRYLKLIAVCGTLLTLAFLLYDELEATIMLPLCGLMLLLCAGSLFLARKTDTHGKHLEYRTLAEAVRVQTFLFAAGSGVEVADLFCWGLRAEVPWVQEALSALSVGVETAHPCDIRDIWLVNQRDYHRASLRKMCNRKKISDAVIHTAWVVACVMFIFTIMFELFCGGLGPALIQLPQSAIAVARTVIKVTLGSFSAATLFVSDYYGKLSLDRRVADHSKMARLYERAFLRLTGSEQPPEQILTALAREELIENANWLAFSRDNQPDIGI